MQNIEILFSDFASVGVFENGLSFLGFDFHEILVQADIRVIALSNFEQGFGVKIAREEFRASADKFRLVRDFVLSPFIAG